ncbi:MAG: AAA family ATPase, partial [Acidimicrobiales bacterium]|nr:AAA family ATPase [Acidimicrobiales bacterium]
MVRLTVRLLGAMVVEVDGRRVPAPASRRAQALLAYLLLNPGPSSRSSLINGLWPDLHDETRGRKQLSQELWRVRNTLEEAGAASLVENSNHFIGLATTPHRPDGADEEIWLTTDIAEFGELIAAARRAKPGSAAELSALEEAAELYVGDLLDGLFDDWLTVPRGNLRDQARLVFDRLVELRTARGLYDAARPVARRLVDLDPLSEESHRRLIRLEMLSSRPTAALAAWNACREILELELGLEPDEETIALRDEIIRSRSSTQRAAGEPPVGAHAPLVGRRPQIAAATACAADFARGAPTLLAIDGGWGAGKSRLLDEFGRSARVRGARVARAHGDPAELATVRSLLSSILTPIELQRLRTRVPAHLQPALGVLVPAVAGNGTRDTRDESSQSLALLHALAALCETHALVLAIDDCHRCDDRSAELLLDIANSLDGSRLALAVTYRAQAVDSTAAAGRLINSVAGSPACRQLSLGRLDRADISELVLATSPWVDADSTTAALQASGATTPWLVIHTLETMQRVGAVAPSQFWTGDLSDSTMDALGLELAGLPSPQSEVLAALARNDGVATFDE